MSCRAWCHAWLADVSHFRPRRCAWCRPGLPASLSPSSSPLFPSLLPSRLPCLPYVPSLASIIIDLGLRGPRLYYQQFAQLPLRVRTAIYAWNPLPCHNFTTVHELEAHTDGSATMTDQWPQVPSTAGWNIVVFARDVQGIPWLLGALWGPVATLTTSCYFLGATRPTSPVAEMSAPLILLLRLRAIHIVLPLRCYTDSTNTAGHINTLQKATAEPVLVRRLRQEVRWYRAQVSFEAVHYPGHIGFPPMNVLM